MQAVMSCVLRSLTLPRIIRHDRGPEMTNCLMEEIMSLLGIRELEPAPFRPMEVGMGETIHREVNKQMALILEDVVRAQPREWPRTTDLIHFVMMNSPILESGLTPRDVDRAWSLKDHVERELLPFETSGGQPYANLSQWAQSMFEHYRLIQGSLSRCCKPGKSFRLCCNRVSLCA